MVKRKKAKFGPARKAYRRGKKPMSKSRAKAQAARRNRDSVRAQVGLTKFLAVKVEGGYDVFYRNIMKGGREY